MASSIATSAASFEPNPIVDFLFTFIKAVIAFTGFALNSIVIYVTVRAPWLHGNCNLLLGFYEFCVIAYDVNFLLDFVFLLILHDNDLVITFAQCFYTFGPLLAIFSASFIFMVAIALDRLLSVIYPINYNLIPRHFYFLGIFLSAIGYAIFILQFAYRNAMQRPNALISCGTTSTLLQSTIFLTAFNLAFELIAMAIYAWIWLAMRKFSTGEENANTYNRTICKTLLAIVLAETFGFTSNSAFHLSLQFVAYADATIYYANQVPNCLALCSTCSGAIILYTFSSEYRRAFHKYVPFIKYILPKNGQVSNSEPPVFVHVTQLPNNRQPTHD